MIVETEKKNYLNDIEKIKKSFEDFLSARVKSDFGSLDIFDAIRASVLSGGKRIRPIITILISSLLGLKKKKFEEASKENTDLPSLRHFILIELQCLELKKQGKDCKAK